MVPAAAWIALSAALAPACGVPVFRWRLENRPARSYTVRVCRAEALSPDARGALEAFRAAATDGACNIELEITDAPSKSAGSGAAGVTVRFPADSPRAGVAWEGPLSSRSVRRLLDSPARRELARRLLAGDSGVWLLVGSGDAARDAAAERRLRQTLRTLESELHLPAPALEGTEPCDEGVLREVRSDVPLKLDFSVVALARDDPAERPFVRMLLATESDLRDFDAPIAFPVFGRGHVPFALVGRGINARQIRLACEQMVSNDACTTPFFTGGVELLMSVDWAAGLNLKPTIGPGVPTATVSGLRMAEAKSEPSSERVAAADPGPTGSGGLLRSVLVAAGGIVLAVGVGWLALRMRYRRQAG